MLVNRLINPHTNGQLSLLANIDVNPGYVLEESKKTPFQIELGQSGICELIRALLNQGRRTGPRRLFLA